MTIPVFAPRRAMEGGATRPTNNVLTGPAPNLRVASVVGKSAGAHGRTREVAALLIWTAALFLALALASYAGDPPSIDGAASVTPPGANWVGPVGALVALGLVR